MASPRKGSRMAYNPFGDFSDISSDESRMEAIRNSQTSRGLSEIAASPSRFLKRNQALGERHLMPKESPFLGGGLRPPTSTSQTRASAALLKLAQLETKFRSRKAQRGPSDAGPDPQIPEASLATGARALAELSSQATGKVLQRYGRAQSGGPGSRFLKKKEPPAEEPTTPAARLGEERAPPAPTLLRAPARPLVAPDSDEEEMRELLGSLLESSGEEGRRRIRGVPSTDARGTSQAQVPSSRQVPVTAGPAGPSLSGEELPSPTPFRKPRPPSTRSASRTPPRIRSRTSSPQTPSPSWTASRTSGLSVTGPASRPGPPRMRRRPTLPSSPRRSEAGPSEGSSETTDDSLNDFRINILPLEDLALALGEEASLIEDGERARRESPARPGPGPEGPTGQGPPRRTQAWSAVPLDGEEAPPTESEVSERLSAESGGASQDPSASTVSSAYSDDFEASPGAAPSQPTGCSETSEALSEEPSWSEGRSQLAQRPQASRKRVQGVTRVNVKEMAVQTPDPAFTYRWAEAAGAAAISPAWGGTYVDPTPIASHVVSADSIEALTAHSPAMLVLNDLLRQQLALTQHFLEANRHLHASLLASLDQDSFHYHTLEEAKEYIRCHKPAPLTLEAALEEVQKELGV
ncbi:uncharacterized protein C19orf44 homolog [Echinops telfairi]|uniref:Uncharacterized protein C19orf44 homolog n=2 Tax=Echinops telfairi TaxID=9371 RepID=A0ABM1VJT1_ECHTE|nr:uncharacterized protein C19orf44 homolog [Echinops telfairi]XP_045145615.1 uncharacterized protein C19orf44 homolog [Echinops telfairi]